MRLKVPTYSLLDNTDGSEFKIKESNTFEVSIKEHPYKIWMYLFK